MSSFEGFAAQEIALGEATIFARVGGSGPPLLLIHGYPQSHLMWARVAPALAATHSVIVPDLRGYGRSSAPPSHKGERYTKRVMAKDMIGLMHALGFERFAVAGHDRGGRVGYRLALDHPDVVTKIATLDIVPTWEMWAGMDAARAMSVYHWMFLAQPEPTPETLISAAPDFYIDQKLASWAGDKTLRAFTPEALEAYRAAFRDPARVHATCEDYRAGATIDRALDEADRAAGRKIAAPLLALWGTKGIPAKGEDPLAVWRRWAGDVRGLGIEAGHFLPEEAPEATARALSEFF